MVYDALEQHDADLDDPDCDAERETEGKGRGAKNKNNPAPAALALTLALNTSQHSTPNGNGNGNASGNASARKNTVRALRQFVHSAKTNSIALANRSRSQTDSSYEIVEEDDYEEYQEEAEDKEFRDRDHPDDPTLTSPLGRSALPRENLNTSDINSPENNQQQNSPEPRSPSAADTRSSSILPKPSSSSSSFSPATATATTTTLIQPKPRPLPPILRTGIPPNDLALCHPTPVDDQRVRLASYSDKIELLERTAERLSMTSSITDAIRDLHGELKRNDSRRSPLRSTAPDAAAAATTIDSAIDDRINIAPAAHQTNTSRDLASITTAGLARSASKSSRFGSRPEPELEGRPLDSFVQQPAPPVALPLPPPPPPPTMAAQPEPTAQSSALADDEDAYSPVDRRLEVRNPEPRNSNDMSSPSSTYSYDAEKMFAGFDGTHVAPQPPQPQQRLSTLEPVDALGISPRRASFGQLLTADGIDSGLAQRPVKDRLSFAPEPVVPRQPRISSAERMSMAMSQSYQDPQTGQQMLYYPAPVPVMLKLPQKLSSAPSSIARTKRRTQALSVLPEPARGNAIWLPDVLETEDAPHLPENDETQKLEYVPQHQRMSMGGRRVPQDVQHLPPQLRASAFFDLPMPEQVVELKEQSAVATLDSILDASAHAPVTAFTDHLIAGHLGAEVYGQVKAPPKGAPNRGSTANLLSQEEKTPKKRSSAFNILGRRKSSGNVLDAETEKRRAEIIADIRAGKLIRDEDEEEAVASENEEVPEEEQYHGAPTTLLAELQLRKQQQKHRTRPLTTAYPNGLHSTLLQLDAVAQAEADSRKQKPVTLAWEEHDVEEAEEAEDDDDVPLGLIYAKNAQKAQALDANRPIGLLERRDMEDNEPLSRRRDRLQGKVPLDRNSLMSVIPPPPPPPPEEEGETLGERLARLNGEEEGAATDLPKARPVSGDFASEMLSQFGGDLLDGDKDKSKELPTDEEEETLGQRRARLKAEAQARAEEVGAGADTPSPVADPYKRHSMANILHVHPQAGASAAFHTGKPNTGLLGLNQRMGAARASTLNPPSRANAGGFKGGLYNDGQAGTAAPRIAAIQQQRAANNVFNTAALHQFPQPTLAGFGGYAPSPTATNPSMMFGGAGGSYQQHVPMSMAYIPQMQNTMINMGMNMNMNMGMGMGMAGQQMPLNQGQIDMVERWRQSVMQ